MRARKRRVRLRQPAAPDHVVIAARHQGRGGNRPLVAGPCLVEAAAFGQQVAKQVKRQRVRLVQRQKLPQLLFTLGVAVFGKQSPRGAQAAERGFGPACGRPAKAAYRLPPVPEAEDQGTGTIPRLGQAGTQHSCLIVGANGLGRAAGLFERDTQPEESVRISGVGEDCGLQSQDAFLETSDLQQGKPQVMLDARVSRCEQSRLLQRCDCIRRPSGTQQLLCAYQVWFQTHRSHCPATGRCIQHLRKTQATGAFSSGKVSKKGLLFREREAKSFWSAVAVRRSARLHNVHPTVTACLPSQGSAARSASTFSQNYASEM